MADPPLLRIIVGPTASGKERLALDVASRIGAEIVSVDSMKIYKGLDVATAKAGEAEQRGVPHHCLDLVEPIEDFSAAEYVARAEAAIADIAGRGKTPLLSGGTAFYYLALLAGMFAGPGADPAVRAELGKRAERDGVEALHGELARLDPRAAEKIHPRDLRRLVRALEVIRVTGEAISSRQTQWAGFHGGGGGPLPPRPRHSFSMVRIVRDRGDLHRRIAERIERMAKNGLREEAERAYALRENLARTPLQAVGYKELFPYFSGEASWADALERLRLNTNRLVRKQETWFRKFPAVEIALSGDDHGAAAAHLAEAWE
ncbi:MAG: tRNA (adenosine(37)-N6)-dimethylallyltransferase MiaA [Planctomycetota bacterium]|jgi:tRNA dimethylallyltransferase|nr:tRNA (adenosine(37)-N6)-dimethylallyltransferase MiaA [Planctomycetota bacterium]